MDDGELLPVRAASRGCERAEPFASNQSHPVPTHLRVHYTTEERELCVGNQSLNALRSLRECRTCERLHMHPTRLCMLYKERVV